MSSTKRAAIIWWNHLPLVKARLFDQPKQEKWWQTLSVFKICSNELVVSYQMCVRLKSEFDAYFRTVMHTTEALKVERIRGDPQGGSIRRTKRLQTHSAT